MYQPTVSILIPTYNRAKYIGECLDSLLAQTIPALEIIVIDDGSEDGTAELVGTYGERVRYLRKENGGKSTAVNVGLEEARGDFIWIFDDDDVALPDAIETRLAVLAANPEAGFVYSQHYYGSDGPDGRIVRGRLHVVPEHDPDTFFQDLMLGCFFHLATALVKRELYLQLGGFDTSLLNSEDYDMQLQLARSHAAVRSAAPSFIFRQHLGMRGPKAIRYMGGSRSKMFRCFDQRVGQKLRKELELREYLSRDAQLGEASESHRAALLARMRVMASKGCISEMLEDLRAVLRLPRGEEKPLAAVVKQAICTGYAWSAIEDGWPAFRTSLADLKGVPGGRAVIRAMAMGCLALAKGYPGSLGERLAKGKACVRLLMDSIS